MYGTPEYHSWRAMIDRCCNSNSAGFDRYGGRGIVVCDAWRRSFKQFFADMGARPAGMSLDRIKNDRGYFPDNCRWATAVEQSVNRRCSLAHLGELERRERKAAQLRAWRARRRALARAGGSGSP